MTGIQATWDGRVQAPHAKTKRPMGELARTRENGFAHQDL